MQCFFYIDGGDLCGEPATYIQSPTVVGKEITRLSCAIVNYFFAQKKKKQKNGKQAPSLMLAPAFWLKLLIREQSV